jgi:phosphate transport system substrate-binding protein
VTGQTKLLMAVATAGATLAVAACGSSSHSSSSSSAKSGSAASSRATELTGAGSTLVAPLISVWAPEYQRTAGVTIVYSAIGSGGGIASITARDVDFGASDAPLTEDEFKDAKGVEQIPWALAATLVAYNVPGVGNELKLTGPVLAEIFLGKITNWDDPKIQALNPGVKLPSLKITPVYRTDGSGDTFAFTNYLSHISPEFKEKIGNSTQVRWPVGIGGKGNSGVGTQIASTPGAIGYIAIAYVLENHYHFALIQNAAGRYPVPDVETIEAAARAVTSAPENNAISLVDPPASAPNAYPIATFTYVLVPLESPKAETLKAFLKWAITTGQKFGPHLDFAPLPPSVVKIDEAAIEKIKP